MGQFLVSCSLEEKKTIGTASPKTARTGVARPPVFEGGAQGTD